MKRVYIYYIIIVLALAAFIYYEVSTKTKLAFVDTQAVYDQFLLKKEFEKQYKGLVNMHKKYLDSLLFDYQLAEKQNAQVAVLDLKKENYLQKKQEMESVEEEMNTKLSNQTWTQINQYIKDYGVKNNYDFIFGASGNGNIMYASESKNITNDVIEFINNRYQGK